MQVLHRAMLGDEEITTITIITIIRVIVVRSHDVSMMRRVVVLHIEDQIKVNSTNRSNQ